MRIRIRLTQLLFFFKMFKEQNVMFKDFVHLLHVSNGDDRPGGLSLPEFAPWLQQVMIEV